jgi:hypothetical protein
MSKKFAAFDALALRLDDEEAGVFSEGEDDFVEQQDYSDDDYDNLMTNTLKNDANNATFVENTESESDEKCENDDEISLPLNNIAPSSSVMSFTSEISSLPNSHSVMSFECHDDAVTSKASSPTSSSSPPLVASIATNKFFKNTTPEPVFKKPDFSQINSNIVRKKVSVAAKKSTKFKLTKNSNFQVINLNKT